MSNGFTPGPWIVGEPGMVATKATGADGWEICDIRADVPECDANADLIAAAPELLSALEALVRINEEHNAAMIEVIGKPAMWNDSYLDAARAAIAKARGTA